MNELALLDICREASWVILLVSAPLLLIGMAVGVAVALVQALTTLQEASLSFVPKLFATLLALVLCLPFMLATLIEFTQETFSRIVEGG